MGSFVQPSMRIALLGISLLSCWGTMRVVTADAAIVDGMVDEATAVLQLRFGSVVKVVDQKSGRSVQVTINDRGPFVKGRIIDLSKAAAKQLGIIPAGTGSVCLIRV